GGIGIDMEAPASMVTVAGNSIAGNAGLGIELRNALNGSGISENDPNDLDAGANGLQNFPEISAVTVLPASVKIEGSLDVPLIGLNFNYDLRAFASSECDPMGNGEGETYLGTERVDFGGTEDFSITLPVQVEPGAAITMTATSVILGTTSEFSDCFVLPIPLLCGDATLDGEIAAGDALLALRTAVGTATCDLCICDVQGSGTVTATDALLILRFAVGQMVLLDCAACE
ncbi:MAG: hypothetical protein ABR538_05350, partial [Candidatus Binatia bacterium]